MKFCNSCGSPLTTIYTGNVEIVQPCLVCQQNAQQEVERMAEEIRKERERQEKKS